MKIVFVASKSVEEWSPESITKYGSGASESGLVEVAKGLQTFGHDVTVYAACRGVFDGVKYFTTPEYHLDPCDVLISSRTPTILKTSNADKHILWCHDIDYDTITPELKIDYTVCSTNWHANILFNAHPYIMVRVIPLGINPTHYVERHKKSHSFIWTSMPQRGLYELLQMWPHIKSMWNDASLNIYYGWDVYDKLYKSSSYLAFKWQVINKLARSKDVLWHGRVSKQELINKFLETDIWYYPSNYFEEVFCSSALEAQASGCLCVARNNGCLSEVIGDRGIIFPNENKIGMQLEALKQAENTPRLRSMAREWALSCTWESVAAQWDSLIRGK